MLQHAATHCNTLHYTLQRTLQHTPQHTAIGNTFHTRTIHMTGDLFIRQFCTGVAYVCVAKCCSVLQCVAVCCSVLQCVAVCYSALLSYTTSIHQRKPMYTKNNNFQMYTYMCRYMYIYEFKHVFLVPCACILASYLTKTFLWKKAFKVKSAHSRQKIFKKKKTETFTSNCTFISTLNGIEI